jgi:hypothetical protein
LAFQTISFFLKNILDFLDEKAQSAQTRPIIISLSQIAFLRLASTKQGVMGLHSSAVNLQRAESPKKARQILLFSLLAAFAGCFSFSIAQYLRHPVHKGLVPVKPLLVWEGTAGDQQPSSSRAIARFELVNKSSRAIRILSVESGCGCAKPTVDPEIVEPNKSTFINVSALSISTGMKDVPIKVRTDSTISPQIGLALRIIGTRQPPYLYQFQGELTFRERYSANLSRRVTVITVEPDVTKAFPVLTSDLHSLPLTPDGEESTQFRDTKFILKKRHFTVSFEGKPPSDTFTGEVTVQDPWDPTNKLALGVLGQLEARLKVVPSSLTLDASQQLGKLLVLSENAPSVIEVREEREKGKQDVLDISVSEKDDQRRFHTITIGRKVRPAHGDLQATLMVRETVSGEEVAVPIRILGETNTVPQKEKSR